jgi:hypothetical protein
LRDGRLSQVKQDAVGKLKVMRSTIATVHVIIAGLLSAALLCACGGGPAASTPQLSSLDVQSALKAQPDAAPNYGRWVYTAQLYGHDLKIYEQNGSSLSYFEEFSGLDAPAGTQSTTNGWWYVTESGASKVDIYRSKKTGPVGPFPPLIDYGQIPINVAVLPNRRLVAVSNQKSTANGPGSVSVYLNRQTDPSRTLTYGGSSALGMGIAITHGGDCYWSFNENATGPGTIVKFTGCNGNGISRKSVASSSIKAIISITSTKPTAYTSVRRRPAVKSSRALTVGCP